MEGRTDGQMDIIVHIPYIVYMQVQVYVFCFIWSLPTTNFMTAKIHIFFFSLVKKYQKTNIIESVFCNLPMGKSQETDTLFAVDKNTFSNFNKLDLGILLPTQ